MASENGGSAPAPSTVSSAAASSSAHMRELVTRRKLEAPVYYADYLQLDKILSAQRLKSEGTGSVLRVTPAEVFGTPAHDEHLFIIVHQAYELWFKQMLWEIDAVRVVFTAPPVDDRVLSSCVARLSRVTIIQSLLIQQVSVLESMAPMDFLDFRDVLFPASGFQSTQFRLIENKLGLRAGSRLAYGARGYCSYLSAQDAATVAAAEAGPSLHDLIESWLERTPFLTSGAFDFWREYEAAVAHMLDEDERFIRGNAGVDELARGAQLKELAAQREHFASLFDPARHDALRARGDRRLSYRATQAALLINLYHEEPILQLPYRLLCVLCEIDENLTAWRHRHALMVHRQIGVRMGTGGSSGYHYLRATADRHKIFTDLTNLSTFLIPRTMLPQLPIEMRAELSFAFSPAAAMAVADSVTAGTTPRSPGMPPRFSYASSWTSDAAGASVGVADGLPAAVASAAAATPSRCPVVHHLGTAAEAPHPV